MTVEQGALPPAPAVPSMIDIAAVRDDTPAASAQTFLLSAGASLMPRPVVAAMHEYLDLEASLGGYSAYERESARLSGVYASVARLINADAGEIALVPSATSAWQMACYSLPLTAGDVVLTSEAEYGANYVALLQLKARLGIEVRVVPSDDTGELDLSALVAMMTPKVKLISLAWVPTNGGLTHPAAEVGRIARAHGVAYLLDACQAVGQMPVDVEALGCDMLSATGRKFLRGPRGTGFLFVRKDFIERLEPHMIDHFSAPWTARDRYTLRADARRYETWEANYGARLGLGVAIDYALAIGMEAIASRCCMLADRLRAGLAQTPGVTVRDLGRHPSAIVTFTTSRAPAEQVVRQAAAQRIVISASPPASTLIDAERRGLPALVRASPHYFNTEEEVDRLAGFVNELAL